MEVFSLVDLSIIVIAGAAGALAHALVLGEVVAFPALIRQDGRLVIGSGFLAYLLLGMVIALGINLFLQLADPLKQAGLALASGFGAGAFHASLFNRLIIWKERTDREIEREKTRRIINKYEEEYQEILDFSVRARARLEEVETTVAALTADRP